MQVKNLTRPTIYCKLCRHSHRIPLARNACVGPERVQTAVPQWHTILQANWGVLHLPLVFAQSDRLQQ